MFQFIGMRLKLCYKNKDLQYNNKKIIDFRKFDLPIQSQYMQSI